MNRRVGKRNAERPKRSICRRRRIRPPFLSNLIMTRPRPRVQVFRSTERTAWTKATFHPLLKETVLLMHRTALLIRAMRSLRRAYCPC